MAARLAFSKVNESLIFIRHAGWDKTLGILTKIESENGEWSFYPIWEHYTATTLLIIATEISKLNDPTAWTITNEFALAVDKPKKEETK
jgi:hypothetical protein